MTTDIPATGASLTTEAGEPLTTEAGEALTVAAGTALPEPAVDAASPGHAAAPECALCRRLLAALDRAAAWLRAMA
jgi:hypothetical protein